MLPFLSLFAFLHALFPFLFPLGVTEGEGGGASGGNGAPTGTGLTQADLDHAVAAAQAEAAAAFGAQFKQATGHDSLDAFQEAEAKRKGETDKLLEQRTAELAETRARLERMQIEAAIHAAAADAVDPPTVVALLSGQAKVVGADVTIAGKPAAEAVAALLQDKPFLAKAAGGSGSGTPPQGGTGAKTLTRAAFEAMSPSERSAHLAAGGTLHD